MASSNGNRRTASKLSQTKHKNWMKGYHDRSIFDLALPGTHNSGTYKWSESVGVLKHFIALWSKCQRYSIYKQLRGGIRRLDFRLRKRKKDGQYYHGHTIRGAPLLEMLDDIAKFLDEQPTELVVVTVRSEHKYHIDFDEVERIFHKRFGTKLISYNKAHPWKSLDKPIGQFTRVGQQLLVIPDRMVKKSWSTEGVKPANFKKHLVKWAKENTARLRNKRRFSDLSAALGQDAAVIANRLTTNGLESLALETKKLFLPALKKIGAVNMVTVDFPDDEIVEAIIRKNGSFKAISKPFVLPAVPRISMCLRTICQTSCCVL